MKITHKHTAASWVAQSRREMVAEVKAGTKNNNNRNYYPVFYCRVRICSLTFSFWSFRSDSFFLYILAWFWLISHCFFSSSFLACMNASFSLVCVRIYTVFVFFFFSLCKSSFLSSIFSFSVWFSILSCSKSIKCKPSASSSFFLSIFWFLISVFLRRRMSRRNSYNWMQCLNIQISFLAVSAVRWLVASAISNTTLPQKKNWAEIRLWRIFSE